MLFSRSYDVLYCSASGGAPPSSRAIVPYIEWNVQGPSDRSSGASACMKETPRSHPLSYYHLLMTDGFPTSSPPPAYIFGNHCPDSVHHGESLRHSSSSKEGQSFHYPRSLTSHVFHLGQSPTREEDSINRVETHELNRSALIGGDKPPPSPISVLMRFLFPCFLDDLAPSYRGELCLLIRTLLGASDGGFPGDLKPTGYPNSAPG